jgi:hypothetical protein
MAEERNLGRGLCLAFHWLWFDSFHGGNMKVFERISQHFPGNSGIKEEECGRGGFAVLRQSKDAHAP